MPPKVKTPGKEVDKKATSTKPTKESSKKDITKVSKPSSKQVKDVTKKASSPTDELRAVVLILLTKCNGKPSMLLVQENYEKWGMLSGGIESGETPEKALEREFKEETGHSLPSMKKQKSFRYRNAMVYLGYTESCIDSLSTSRKKPHELLSVELVPLNDIYKLLDNPKPNMPLRSIMISMMMDNKKEVEEFLKGM